MGREAVASAVEKAVRQWVEREVPGEETLAAHAAWIATEAFLAGATVSEACRAAHRFVHSWRDHPANDHAVGLSPHLGRRADRAS